MQGCHLDLGNVHIKSSHSIYYNWKVDDALVIFTIKARLSILPTNFILHLWNRDHSPECPYCHRHTESVAHLLNGCNEFKKFYSRRHDRIVNKITEFIKENNPRTRISSNLLAETIFPEFKEEIKQIVHRKPDIFILNRIQMQCTIVEITVCYDLYLENAHQGKVKR